MFSFLLIQALSRYRGRIFIFIMLFVFAVIAFFRGSVGTDTANYELMLGGFTENYIWDGREPGFVLLSWFLVSMFPSVELAVRAIALIFFGLLAWFVVRSDQNERFLLMAYLLPAFAYQYSMNGLRIGIASVVMLLAIQTLRRKGEKSAFITGLLALLFHYTSVFSLLFVAVSQRSWFRFSNCVPVFAVFIIFGLGLVFLDIYIIEKVEVYKEMQAPGMGSGLSKVVPVFLILVGLLLGNLPGLLKFKLFILSFVSVSAAWFLAQYSYAGLRVLDLLSFSVPLSVLATYSRMQLNFDLFTKLTMVAAGLVSAAGVFRGFLLSHGEGKSPFLPYELSTFGLF